MKKLLLLFFILISLLFVGCSASVQTDTSTAQNQTQETDNDQTPENNQGVSLLDLFSSEVDEYKIDYEITSSLGEIEQTIASTLYFDLPDRVRNDASLQGLESRSYWIDSSYYSCTQLEEEWSCFEFESSTDDFQEIPQTSKELVENSAALSSWQFSGTKTLVGLTASCFTSSSTDGYASEICLSSKGILLYMDAQDSSSGGLIKMQALSYEESVSSSDFELPAEPQSFEFPSFN